MLRLFKKSNLNSLITGRVSNGINRFISKTFSSGHNSESDHSDHEHGHHEHHSSDEGHHTEEAHQYERSYLYNSAQETFSVKSLLDQAKRPLNISKPASEAKTELFETEQEYVNFLAETFARKAAEQYPDYKKDLTGIESYYPGYGKLNAYQKEVYALDFYMVNSLTKQDQQIRDASNTGSTPLELIRNKVQYYKGN